MKYDVDYFIKKFEAIPEGLWIVGVRHGTNGKHCAHGWCNLNDDRSFSAKDFLCSEEEMWLVKVFTPIMGGTGIARINNGLHKDYPQLTPKQRVLAALYDIKKLQPPKKKKVRQKVKTVYVSVPVSITEQAKELIQS